MKSQLYALCQPRSHLVWWFLSRSLGINFMKPQLHSCCLVSILPHVSIYSNSSSIIFALHQSLCCHHSDKLSLREPIRRVNNLNLNAATFTRFPYTFVSGTNASDFVPQPALLFHRASLAAATAIITPRFLCP